MEKLSHSCVNPITTENKMDTVISKGQKIRKQKGGTTKSASVIAAKTARSVLSSSESDTETETYRRKRRGGTTKRAFFTAAKKTRNAFSYSESDKEDEAYLKTPILRKQNLREQMKETFVSRKKQKMKSESAEVEEACKLFQSASHSKTNKVALLHSLIIDLSRQICNGNSQEATNLIENDLSPLLLNQKSTASDTTRNTEITSSTNDIISTLPTTTTAAIPDINALQESVLSGLRGYQSHFEQLTQSLSEERLANEKLKEELDQRKAAAKVDGTKRGLKEEKNLQLQQELRHLDEKHRRATDALTFQTSELQQEKRRRSAVENQLLELREEQRKWKVKMENWNSSTTTSGRATLENSKKSSSDEYDIDI
jgi:hypothetical protein